MNVIITVLYGLIAYDVLLTIRILIRESSKTQIYLSGIFSMNPFAALATTKSDKSHRKKRSSKCNKSQLSQKAEPDIDRQGFLLALSEELTCPITGQFFVRPVVTLSGNTYEKSALIKVKYDPVSFRKLTGDDLPVNRLAELLIERFGDDLRKLPTDIVAPRVPVVPKWLIDRRDAVDSEIKAQLATHSPKTERWVMSPYTFPYKRIFTTLFYCWFCFSFGAFVGKKCLC